MDSPAKIPYSRHRYMPAPLKPPALRSSDTVRIVSLSSPMKEERVMRGCEELGRLGYKTKLDRDSVFAKHGFFAGSAEARVSALKTALTERETRAIFCTRGGYGSNYLLDCLSDIASAPKLFCGFSDVTSLHSYFWQKFRWVTLYGPMVAAGLDHGANAPKGYDRESLVRALTETKQGWTIDLQGEAMSPGVAAGTLLGGCMYLVEATIGTPSELDTEGSILILEDRGMKPWHLDRALMHLKQAGKLRNVAGLIFGDFPDSEPPAGTESVKDVVLRILVPLGIPIVWGAPVGHTSRPMLTLPLGVSARLSIGSETKLEILEPACAPRFSKLRDRRRRTSRPTQEKTLNTFTCWESRALRWRPSPAC
jgi:muramoyltetrapeptide carboxypeptidase